MAVRRQRSHLFVPSKFDYVRGKRPQVDCILCEIISQKNTVDRLEVHRTDLFLVSLNLHPYNPGHLMVFPLRHVLHPAEFTKHEVQAQHELSLASIRILESLYQPR